ncbi:MAG: hypothetical protein AAF823_02925 [Planctomycetota bacterium]
MTDMPQRHAIFATMLFACGAMVLQRGVYLYTAEVHAFSAPQNLAVSVLYGLAYIFGAAAFAPWLGRRYLASRMAGIAVALGAAGLLMNAVGHLASMAVVAMLMGGLIGAAWPLLNGMILADRSPRDYRVMIGRFNLSWAVGVPICMVGCGWLLHYEPKLLPVFACLVLVGVALVLTVGAYQFVSSSKKSINEQVRSLGEIQDRAIPQAVIFTGRWGMVICYSLMFTLIPVQPAIFGELGYTPSQAAYFSITFDIARLLTFCAMIATPVWIGSFTGLSLAMLVAPIAMGLSVAGENLTLVLLGHVGLGAAAGYLYYAPLMHGLAENRSAVASTGKHEAVRGASLIAGPLLGMWGASTTASEGLRGLVWTVVMPAAVLMVALIICGGLAGTRKKEYCGERRKTDAANSL